MLQKLKTNPEKTEHKVTKYSKTKLPWFSHFIRVTTLGLDQETRLAFSTMLLLSPHRALPYTRRFLEDSRIWYVSWKTRVIWSASEQRTTISGVKTDTCTSVHFPAIFVLHFILMEAYTINSFSYFKLSNKK